MTTRNAGIRVEFVNCEWGRVVIHNRTEIGNVDFFWGADRYFRGSGNESALSQVCAEASSVDHLAQICRNHDQLELQIRSEI